MNNFIQQFMKPAAFEGNNPMYFAEGKFESYIKNEFYCNMGRYLIFRYTDFYPSGGMEDLIVRTDKLDELIKIFELVEDKYLICHHLKYYDLETNEYEDVEIHGNKND